MPHSVVSALLTRKTFPFKRCELANRLMNAWPGCMQGGVRSQTHTRPTQDAKQTRLMTSVKWYHSSGWSSWCPTVLLGGGWKHLGASRASSDRLKRARLRSYLAWPSSPSADRRMDGGREGGGGGGGMRSGRRSDRPAEPCRQHCTDGAAVCAGDDDLGRPWLVDLDDALSYRQTTNTRLYTGCQSDSVLSINFQFWHIRHFTQDSRVI